MKSAKTTIKLNIKLEPYGLGVNSREEAGYYGYTVNGKYYEIGIKEGQLIFDLIKAIKLQFN